MKIIKSFILDFLLYIVAVLGFLVGVLPAFNMAREKRRINAHWRNGKIYEGCNCTLGPGANWLELWFYLVFMSCSSVPVVYLLQFFYLLMILDQGGFSVLTIWVCAVFIPAAVMLFWYGLISFFWNLREGRENKI